MSCVATPAHASESFEWRIRQRSRHGSRFSEADGGELLYLGHLCEV